MHNSSLTVCTCISSACVSMSLCVVDDSGATKRYQGKPAQDLHWIHRRIPQHQHQGQLLSVHMLILFLFTEYALNRSCDST